MKQKNYECSACPRGRFRRRGLLQKMKAIVPLLIPLFVSSFNRAEDLATAMEARGYQGGEGRTKYRILHWHQRDTLVVIVLRSLQSR